MCVAVNFSCINYYIARLMQLTAATSYCYDSAIFSCVNEDRSYVTWKLRNEEEGLFYTGSFTIFSPISSTTATQTLNNITVEITFINSSFMATTLTITKISLLVPVTVVCDTETREELEYNEIPGNLDIFVKPMLANVMPGDTLQFIFTRIY